MNPIHIIVGSQMGAAEAVADELAAAIEQAGFAAVVHEMPQYDDIPKADVHWLVCTSTHGAGDLPDNLVEFAKQLQADKPDLSVIKYGIIGLGDTSYDTFCQAAHQMDQLLTQLNAEKVAESLEINALDPDLPEDYALAWLPSWLNAL